MMAAIDKIINASGEKLGFEKVKDHQRNGLKALIEGKGVFVVQPMGYGKSAIPPPPFPSFHLFSFSFSLSLFLRDQRMRPLARFCISSKSKG